MPRSARSPTMRAPAPIALRSPDGAPAVSTRRLRLADGAVTTVHAAAFPLAAVAVRVVRLTLIPE